MRRENTPLAKNEVEKLEDQIAQIKEELSILRQQWEQEKKIIETIKEKKDQFEKLRFKKKKRNEKPIIIESQNCAIASFQKSKKN